MLFPLVHGNVNMKNDIRFIVLYDSAVIGVSCYMNPCLTQ